MLKEKFVLEEQIQKLCQEFYYKTGFCVNHIWVDKTEIKNINDQTIDNIIKISSDIIL